MAWLRIDDRFATHPKIASLNDREFRVWVRVLCYCAAYRTDGKVTAEACGEIKGLGSRDRRGNVTVERHALSRYVTLGLLKKAPKIDAWIVNDWHEYNPKDPTAAERQRRRRAKNGRDTTRDTDRDENVTRARSRARGPVPSPLHLESEGTGRNRSEETDDAAPASPNGAAPLIDRLRTYVHKTWDDYPDLGVLQDELTDRGLTLEQATGILEAEAASRT